MDEESKRLSESAWELSIIILTPTSGRSGYLFAKYPQVCCTAPPTTLRHTVIEGEGCTVFPFKINYLCFHYIIICISVKDFSLPRLSFLSKNHLSKFIFYPRYLCQLWLTASYTLNFFFCQFQLIYPPSISRAQSYPAITANINLPALLISKALLFPHSKTICKIKYSDQQSSEHISIFSGQ